MPLSARQNEEEAQVPLCVDLDGTLVRTDLLIESGLKFFRTKRGNLLRMLGWALRGRAYLKGKLARRVEIDPESLPYNHSVLSFVRSQHRAGRKVLLTTATDRQLADKIAKHLGCFQEVIGSDGNTNLKGKNKARVLRERFGKGNFDYIGDSPADLPVWESSRKPFSVGHLPGLLKNAKKLERLPENPQPPRPTMVLILKQLRVHQWVKNSLIFLPLLASHRVLETSLLLPCALAFLAFGPCASATYVINDLLDLHSDRKHPHKQHRPIASGALPVAWSLTLIPVLLLASAGIALAVSIELLAAIGGYFALTLLYSFFLKEQPIIDVILLAALYVYRMFVGHVATEIAYSHWLFLFGMFLFLGLAMVKRYAELHQRSQKGNENQIPGRGYSIRDMPAILSLGTTSSFLAILVYTFYITSDDVLRLYSQPLILWLGVPVLLFWSGKTWLSANRGLVTEDPILFALKDRASLAAAALFFLMVLIGK